MEMSPVAAPTNAMKVALWVRFESKPGKEKEVVAFLEKAVEMVQHETNNPLWIALRLGPTSFAIFDSFPSDTGRQAHLNGPIAAALMAQTPTLFTAAPVIESLDVIGGKVPG
jgi:quinol monooxygenase YgiN